MNKFATLGHNVQNSVIQRNHRKLFNKHGKTILPHDTLPLDLRQLGRPGFD